MAAKLRIKCPFCGEVANIKMNDNICPECKKELNFADKGCIYLYRQGSPYGFAGGFSVYLNGVDYGSIGNKELLCIPLEFGTYNIHCAAGMSRKCDDLQVILAPEHPVAYTKVYIKPGFWTNSFVVEPVDPKLLDL